MRIESEQVKHVALLAHLRIDPAELEKWSEQMGAMIDFADQLNELDLNDAESNEPGRASLYNVFREDERKESFDRNKILSNAPEQYEGCYVVPKIVE
jgi:aspartyl-tRNA(Asn)/glutamyl-tRNA(Gln) amidotransferase subunit C